MNRQHYSYTHYANRQVAEGFDSLRFSGPIGELLLETQERLLLDGIAPLSESPAPGRPCAGVQVLDVGTGTGRAAIGLAYAGARVTGVDASVEMLDVARARAAAVTGVPMDVTFDVGDAHALPFPSQHFDVAVSLRVLMHTPDWRRCVGELCRVSRQRVIVDFPSLSSAAAIESLVRHGRRACGAQVESYRVMSERAVRASFAAAGFRIIHVHRQFVLPIAVHKAMGSRRLTEGVERGLGAVGLLWLLGSPVTVVAER
jgi:ubiquinone/menaquinone biosynthesis C-methylase UbiE